MAKSGTYILLHTYARYNAAGTMEYETGRSPTRTVTDVTGTISYGFQNPSDTQINRVRIYSTLASGTVFYLEKVVTITAWDGATVWANLSMADTTLDDQASYYGTNKGYETKRLYASGVLPPMRVVIEASGRLWGLGRMHRDGINEDATLYWSELAPDYRDWPTANGNNVFATPLIGMYEQNEIIYVMTRSSRWKVTPATYNAGMRFDKLEGRFGCVGHHTIQKVGSAVIWLSQEGFVATAGDADPRLISGMIEDTIGTLRMDRALFFVSRYDADENVYECAVSDGTSRLNNLTLCADLDPGILQPRWWVKHSLGRTVFSMASGIMPDGDRAFFLGDHLGNVWQEKVGWSDGVSDGGTYQGTLSYGTTSSSTTTT